MQELLQALADSLNNVGLDAKPGSYGLTVNGCYVYVNRVRQNALTLCNQRFRRSARTGWDIAEMTLCILRDMPRLVKRRDAQQAFASYKELCENLRQRITSKRVSVDYSTKGVSITFTDTDELLLGVVMDMLDDVCPPWEQDDAD